MNLTLCDVKILEGRRKLVHHIAVLGPRVRVRIRISVKVRVQTLGPLKTCHTADCRPCVHCTVHGEKDKPSVICDSLYDNTIIMIIH